MGHVTNHVAKSLRRCISWSVVIMLRMNTTQLDECVVL